MDTYRKRIGYEVEAYQWFRRADDAGDVAQPGVHRERYSPALGRPRWRYFVKDRHGREDTLYAGDWILTDDGGASFWRMSPHRFKAGYAKVEG